MLKIYVEPITPKLLNKKTAHSTYIKHTEEEASALRDLIEQVKSKYPLDHSLESACRYAKLIQELLTNISKTCLSINNSGEKSVAVTPKNKDKRGHMNMVVYQMDVKTALLMAFCAEKFMSATKTGMWVQGNPNHVYIMLKDGLFMALTTSSSRVVNFGFSMVENRKLDEDTQGKAIDPTHYRGMIGTLMGLWYPKDSSIALTAYADADHTGCQDTRQSTFGCMQLLGDRLVSWSSKRQKSVAISNTEAEYITLSGCCAQVFWMRSQLTDYGLGFNKIPIFHFIKEQVENGVVEFYFVNTEYQLTDIFTKALGRERIEFLIKKLGMRSFTPKTLKQLADEAEE
ncbi:hypothetical protein Tco_0390418 [Tanacetum coccineum]